MVRRIAAGLVGALVIALGASCGGDDDDDDASLETGGTGTGGRIDIGNGGAGAEGGNGSAQGGEGGSGQIAIGECESIQGLNVNSECASSAVEGQIKTINMLLVMDKSTSMVDNPFDAGAAPGAGGAGGGPSGGGAGGGQAVDGAAGAGGAGALGATRWDVLKQALGNAMTATQGSIDYGLVLYPSGDGCTVSDGVQVAVGTGSTTVPDIVSALEDNPPDVSGTPMAAALDAALEYYTNGDGADLTGEKYVLLATDGGPNCNDSLTCGADECTLDLEGTFCVADGSCCDFDASSCVDHADVTAKLVELHDAGIDTFVVGIPGSEAYASWLGEFADAGGRNPDGAGSYYEVSAAEGAAGLTDTFTEIALQLVTDCEIPIDVNVPSAGDVNVAIDCAVLPQNGDSSGWEFNDDFTQITISGDMCDEIQTTGVGRIDVIFGCPVVQ
jgi:hypothetical protein